MSSWWMMRGVQYRDIGISDIYFHKPKRLLGAFLEEGPREAFHRIVDRINEHYSSSMMRHEVLLSIVDEIDNSKRFGTSPSMPLIHEVVAYLRINLLSRDTEKVKRTIVLVDVLIKNCQFRVHYSIGRKRFMKTLSKVARWYHYHRTSTENSIVADLALDCIQSWSQSFYPRRNLYPYIVDTYIKLKLKYGIHFNRPDIDPTRVPIFLGHLSYADRTMLQTQVENDRMNPFYPITNQSVKSNYSSPSADCDDATEEEGKRSFDEIEDLIKFDEVTAVSTLAPASSNTPIQSYGHLVPSPFNNNQNLSTSVTAPYRGLNRDHVDVDRASLPSLQSSVQSMMESLRNVKRAPPKPPRKSSALESNPDTELVRMLSKVDPKEP